VDIWELYRQRGFARQATDEGALKTLTDTAAAGGGVLTAYTGFDPTADSFHVGHLIPLMGLIHFQRAGHRPIVLLGGGTAMIGDPTGKNEMRKMLTDEELAKNTDALRRQAARLMDFDSGNPSAAIMANNGDWLRQWGYIDFLREIGHHFSVNRMLTFETFKTRMETGLSFIEFNYPLLQAYDFLELSRRYDCTVQLGGDDQWANIISGVDLVRRVERRDVFGWTFPLLTTSSGAKMGKTEKGAVWLDPEKTSPYEYYQYWVNVDDADVAKCLGFFTLLPMEEVNRLSRLEGAEIRQAKQVLAREATRLIHGEEEAAKAEKGAKAVFGGGGDMDQVPSTTLEAARLADGVDLAEVMVSAGLAKSKGEARRLVDQGGVHLNGEKVTDGFMRITAAHGNQGHLMIKVGKKKFHRVVVA